MSDPIGPILPKWPFYLGDGLLLGTAYFICSQSKSAIGHWEICLAIFCVAAGAVLGIAPFLLEYRANMKLAEAGALTTVVSQLHDMKGIAGQISGATGKWQEAQEQAEKTTITAREITERMTVEAKAFTEFLQRANDSEKATLRLEVDKLRRAESDWLQVLVRVLDHIFALNQGALRSGQPKLIEQLSHFQNACRDAARRVGLTPFVADEAQTFDPQRHQLLDESAQPAPDAIVAETIATGYTIQGKLLRPALVRLEEPLAATPPPAAAPAAGPIPDGNQSRLSPESEKMG